MWLTSHVRQIAHRIVEESDSALSRKVSRPPRHIHKDEGSEQDHPHQQMIFE
jgi:hypothetical protein